MAGSKAWFEIAADRIERWADHVHADVSSAAYSMAAFRVSPKTPCLAATYARDDGTALAAVAARKAGFIMLFKKLHIANSLVVVFLAMLLSGPAFAGSGAPSAGTTNSSLVVPARRPPPSQPPMTTAPTKTDEARRYAAREVKAKGLETFVGGDRGIYIGSSVLVVALLVVLILVLI